MYSQKSRVDSSCSAGWRCSVATVCRFMAVGVVLEMRSTKRNRGSGAGKTRSFIRAVTMPSAAFKWKAPRHPNIKLLHVKECPAVQVPAEHQFGNPHIRFVPIERHTAGAAHGSFVYTA